MAGTQSQEKLEPEGTNSVSRRDVGGGNASGASGDNGINAKGGTAEPCCMERESRRVDLLQMPIDIMFVVAGYLSPRDLISLSCTSKALRGALDSPSLSAVWKEARRAAWVPNGPPGFSEPQWAAFAFGRPVCERCGVMNTHNMEPYIRRRVCTRCKRKYLISTVEFPDLFPDCDAVVLDMVPYTWTGGWRPFRYKGKFFWSSDIKRVGEEWALLQDDIKNHVEGAQEKAAAYREQRIREVQCIAERADGLCSWTRNLEVKARKKAIKRHMPRFDAIRTRLLALGYDMQDIAYTAFYPPEFQRGSELTDELWTQIQPRAVALVESRRDARLEGKRARLRLLRIQMLQKLYLQYAKSVVPRQWCYLPDFNDLIEFPACKNIVEDDNSVPESPSSFLPVVEQFPTLIQEWISIKKARITAMLEPTPETVDDPLDLAVSVFECASNPCFGRQKLSPLSPLISWEVVAAHSCQPASQCLPTGNLPTSVRVSHLGSITAAALVREAGLDPASATIAQMDALDLRFACIECSKPGWRMLGSWKVAVKHGMRREHISWRKISSEDAMIERAKEEENKYKCFSVVQESWSCNHCAIYLNNWRSKHKVIQHLSNRHQITSPTEPTDLFWYPGETDPSSNLTTISEPASSNTANV
ncbi:hypothetical protein BD779DRAFT_1474561 [Infundibulicybe gibba]|nr:hypothetical protein BD779DRAFT_1474561 [Infundibulicybe gibba]